jgi:hypothetical protein
MSAVLTIPPVQIPLTPLQELQKEFVILELSGRHGLIKLDELIWNPTMKSAPQLRIYMGVDAKLVLRRRLENIASNLKPTQVIEDFWNNPSTEIYKKLAFSPNPEPPDTLNLWIGATITPKFGSWQTIKSFLYDVICSGELATYQYLIKYLAHMLQKPEEKPGVMVVLLGGEGIGKGTLEQILRKIFSATTVLISDVDSVVGRFNTALERAYVVFMDEALFHGNVSSTERLKSFVTSQYIQIEEKHQPERSIESFHRFFAASNAKHFAHIDPDNRRMFYLKVAETNKGNHQYWDGLYKAIEGCEVEAMAADLWAEDLSNFVVRKRPESSELLAQKIASLPPFERFWFDALFRAETSSLTMYSSLRYEAWEKDHFWPTNEILESFQSFAKFAQRYQTFTSKNLADSLVLICPSAKKVRRSEFKSRAWGYALPPITTARAEFEAYLGGSKIKWS